MHPVCYSFLLMRCFYGVSSLGVPKTSTRHACAFAPGSLLSPMGLVVSPSEAGPRLAKRPARGTLLGGSAGSPAQAAPARAQGLPSQGGEEGGGFLKSSPGAAAGALPPRAAAGCWSCGGSVRGQDLAARSSSSSALWSWAGADVAGSSLTEEMLGSEFYMHVRA